MSQGITLRRGNDKAKQFYMRNGDGAHLYCIQSIASISNHEVSYKELRHRKRLLGPSKLVLVLPTYVCLFMLLVVR